jgi:hypothetical protein
MSVVCPRRAEALTERLHDGAVLELYRWSRPRAIASNKANASRFAAIKHSILMKFYPPVQRSEGELRARDPKLH